jgi:4-hydroxy-2-oxoheptanedioate aldolase
MFTRIARKVSTQTGKQFKESLKRGDTKFGLFINSGSPVIAEQLSHSRYDWLLIDAQHGPINYNSMSTMLSGIGNGKAKSFVRVAGYDDRSGIQQALDAGSDGVLIPYVNNAEEVQQAVNCCLYPEPSKHDGSRSIYFPQRSSNQDGLLGYTGSWNENALVAIQVETADCIENIDEILSVDGLDIAFLGRNDLAMSMGLFEKYEFPDMYTSVELNEAIEKLIAACKKHNKIAGIFLFGTDGVEEAINQGFNFVSVGNDLHHVLVANTNCVSEIRDITSRTNGEAWEGQDSNLIE